MDIARGNGSGSLPDRADGVHEHGSGDDDEEPRRDHGREERADRRDDDERGGRDERHVAPRDALVERGGVRDRQVAAEAGRAVRDAVAEQVGDQAVGEFVRHDSDREHEQQSQHERDEGVARDGERDLAAARGDGEEEADRDERDGEREERRDREQSGRVLEPRRVAVVTEDGSGGHTRDTLAEAIIVLRRGVAPARNRWARPPPGAGHLQLIYPRCG